MRKQIFCLFICLCVLCQVGFPALSKHVVDYRIKAKLLAEEKAVEGHEILTWLNDSEAPVSDLQFHLYLNAFKNNRSTFMKESGGSLRSMAFKEGEWGYVDIKKMEILGRPDLTLKTEFIQPDDQNPDDQTVLRVLLPEPVPPQGRITLELEFYAKLPQVFARTGYYDDFFMVAQWFPKIGVLQDGQWNCHQYHSNSEFFAEFGVFEVAITAPSEFVVGATGKRIQEVDNGDGTKTYTHYQEDVHDFAWTACPDFVEFREPYILDTPPVETEIILLVHRSHLKLKDRYLESLKNGLEFFSQSYGAYPYETITLVDPPIKALGASGMEYPTLFASMGLWYFPNGFRLPELVTIHEFGHGYWYGIVASNEFEEAWLDEGIITYSEMKAMNKYYGEDASAIELGPLKISDPTFHRFQVIAGGIGGLDPIVRKSWEFYSGSSYGLNVYSKAGLTLLTLENYLGEDVMSEVMRTYYERWKFRHPGTEDFIAVAEEVSGQDLAWFFDQFLRSPGLLDYAIQRVRSREIQPRQGMFNGEMVTPESKDNKDQDKTYRNEVVVVRKGELAFPQEILVVFDNGEQVLEKWDGKDRWKRFVYVKPFKLKSASVDPEGKVVLDTNYTNNSQTIKANTTFSIKYALEYMLDFQKILTWLSM